jgi:hypothetical protein
MRRSAVAAGLVAAVLAVGLWTAAGSALGAQCVVPAGVTPSELQPFGVEPAQDIAIPPGHSVDLYAGVPVPVFLEDGTEVSAVAVEATITRRGSRIFRRAGQVVAEAWTPPRAGRYDIRFAALYGETEGGICEVAVHRQVDVFRRVVSRPALLKRIKSMLTRVEKGVQRTDFRAAAATLHNRLSQLSGLRLRSKAGTLALDRWIVATHRLQRWMEHIADRFEAGPLDHSDLTRTNAEVARWLAATKRFVAVIRRVGD